MKNLIYKIKNKTLSQPGFSVLLMILLLNALKVDAQEAGNRGARLESAKIALITERLQLTPTQAQKFWPVYNEYQKQKNDIRRSIQRQRLEVKEELSESQANEILNQRLALQKQEIILDEKYIPLLIETTSAKQILELHNAEAEFRKILLQRLRRRG